MSEREVTDWCSATLSISENGWSCQALENHGGSHIYRGQVNDSGGESNPTIVYEVKWVAQ